MSSFLAGAVAIGLDALEVIVISLTIFVISYIFVFQNHQVIGDSMFPNFLDKEYVLTDKLTYMFVRPPVRGEVVIFKYPKAPEYEYIKRIIGLPGEILKVKEGKIWLQKQDESWQQLDESNYLKSSIITFGRTAIKDDTPFKIPTDSYVVLGDNREVSSDSREWGIVSKNLLIGRALFRLWPPSKLGLVIKNPTYQIN